MAEIVLPTPGGSDDVWGTMVNAALTAINDEQETGRLSPEALEGEFASQDDLTTAIEAVTQQIPLSTVQVVEHGDNPSIARPETSAQVLWVGSVVPNNRIAGDLVFIGDPVPVPVVIWSDSFPVDGPLTTTETGGKTWGIAGTGFEAAALDGKLVFTAGTGSTAAFAYVDGGESDGHFAITIATIGASFDSGVAFRYVSINNHLAMVRKSASDHHYRMVQRQSGAYTDVDTTGATWPIMTDGDRVEIECVGDTISVTINGTLCWSGVPGVFETGTGFGVYCGRSASLAEMAYADAIFETIA